MRGLLGCALLALIAGCTAPATNSDAGGAGGEVELSVDRASYRAGEPIVLTLRNRSAQSVGYNLCGAALERREASAWSATNQQLAEVCTMELRTLAPNATDTYRHTLPAALPAGEYRVRTNVEVPLGGSFTAVASGGFQVIR